MTRPSKFAPEFKARAIDLYRSSEGRTIADVARELGIGTETFRKWVRQDEADRGERDDRLTSKETEELKRLRRENADLKRTNEILRLASAFFAQEGRPNPAQVVTFVETHRHTFGVAPLLAVLGEPVSTFYDRTNREPSMRAVQDTALAERIEAIWERSRRTYGAPRIHAMLARDGIRVGRKRVERLMRQLSIQGAHLRKHWKTTRQDRDATAAPDLVDRDFCATEPNTLWVADLTYVKTLQGILYLAVVLDVFSRKVVGWQMADRMTTDLVLTAFEMGLWRREVVRDRLIHHSDKGSQYTSLRFTQRLADAGVAPSTGSVGDSYDNAVAESFFGTLKTELIYRHSWASRHDAELAIFAWIEGWYNPERIMDGLGMCSPDEYEAAFYADTTNANLDTIVKVGNPKPSLQ